MLKTLLPLLILLLGQSVLYAEENPEKISETHIKENKIHDLNIFIKGYFGNLLASSRQTFDYPSQNLVSKSTLYYPAFLAGFSKNLFSKYYAIIEFAYSTKIFEYIIDSENNYFNYYSRHVNNVKKATINERFLLGLLYKHSLNPYLNINLQMKYSLVYADTYNEYRFSKESDYGSGKLYEYDPELDYYYGSRVFSGISVSTEFEILASEYFSIPIDIRYNYIFNTNYYSENDGLYPDGLSEFWIGLGVQFNSY
ncbi:MAG: hypothetical protein OEZ13_00035 [Spirochaetia bacterium]|nr:hypothetical protein [Spirochaetia bacterium]